MIRALLTLVLSALLALPHGICFCDFVQAASAQEEMHCPCQDTPSSQEACPSTPEEEDDNECPCKLREVMAAQQVDQSDSESIGAWTYAGDGFNLAASSPGQCQGLHHDETAAASLVMPIPCALRI